MDNIFINACTKFFDTLLPPRRTERLVRELSLELLHSIASPDGTLPYHDSRITALVWELKYRKNARALSLAAALLSERAMEFCEESFEKVVLIPVPMHAARKAARGYNQTERLCEAMLLHSADSFLYAPHALMRVRNTIPQQGLARHRRLKNMLGAIACSDATPIQGRVCIVIDDVSTTGATAHETKRALLEGGAEEVHILTLAHS